MTKHPLRTAHFRIYSDPDGDGAEHGIPAIWELHTVVTEEYAPTSFGAVHHRPDGSQGAALIRRTEEEAFQASRAWLREFAAKRGLLFADGALPL